MSGFNQKPIGFKNLLKMYLKNLYRKRKEKIFTSPSLLAIRPAGPFSFSGPHATPSPLLGQPKTEQENCSLLPLTYSPTPPVISSFPP
jgi:hypothetical protein